MKALAIRYPFVFGILCFLHSSPAEPAPGTGPGSNRLAACTNYPAWLRFCGSPGLHSQYLATGDPACFSKFLRFLASGNLTLISNESPEISQVLVEVVVFGLLAGYGFWLLRRAGRWADQTDVAVRPQMIVTLNVFK